MLSITTFSIENAIDNKMYCIEIVADNDILYRKIFDNKAFNNNSTINNVAVGTAIDNSIFY